MCVHKQQKLSEKVTQLSLQRNPSKSADARSAEDQWLLQPSSVSRREENEHCIRRLIKESDQRQSLADVTAYFILTSPLLHRRRVTQPVQPAGSSAQAGVPLSSRCPQAGFPTHAKGELCALQSAPLCSQPDSPPQADHSGFLNVTGLAKEQPKVNSQGSSKNRHARSWARAGRGGIPFLWALEMPQKREVGEISPPQGERCCGVALQISLRSIG